MKVYWVSRHDLSPAQLQAVRDLHGADVEVIKDPMVFYATEGLAEYIRQHSDGFVYAVASAPHYLYAALAGCRFGMFENHPARRQDGTFGLAAVYHVVAEVRWCAGRGERESPWLPLNDLGVIGSLRKVWVNPDPASDRGEALVPVAR